MPSVSGTVITLCGLTWSTFYLYQPRRLQKKKQKLNLNIAIMKGKLEFCFRTYILLLVNFKSKIILNVRSTCMFHINWIDILRYTTFNTFCTNNHRDTCVQFQVLSAQLQRYMLEIMNRFSAHSHEWNIDFSIMVTTSGEMARGDATADIQVKIQYGANYKMLPQTSIVLFKL